MLNNVLDFDLSRLSSMREDDDTVTGLDMTPEGCSDDDLIKVDDCASPSTLNLAGMLNINDPFDESSRASTPNELIFGTETLALDDDLSTICNSPLNPRPMRRKMHPSIERLRSESSPRNDFLSSQARALSPGTRFSDSEINPRMRNRRAVSLCGLEKLPGSLATQVADPPTHSQSLSMPQGLSPRSTPAPCTLSPMSGPIAATAAGSPLQLMGARRGSLTGQRRRSLCQAIGPNAAKRSRKRVAVACVPCNRAKTSCSGERPCIRCQNRGICEECVDVKHRKKGRPKKNKSDMYIPGSLVDTNLPCQSTQRSRSVELSSVSRLSLGECIVEKKENIAKTEPIDEFEILDANQASATDGDLTDPASSRSNSAHSSRAPSPDCSKLARFKQKLLLVWCKQWTPDRMATMINDRVVSPAVHFSVSLVKQALNDEEYALFKSNLYTLFARLGFSPPPFFELFTFSFTLDEQTPEGDELPIATIHCRFERVSPTRLRVHISMSKCAERLFGLKAPEIVQGLSQAHSADLPFLWRLFSEPCWDTLMEMEQLACMGLRQDCQCMVQVENKWGSLIPCAASIRYHLDDSGVFESMVYCLTPLPHPPLFPMSYDGGSAGQMAPTYARAQAHHLGLPALSATMDNMYGNGGGMMGNS
eukprot:18982_1